MSNLFDGAPEDATHYAGYCHYKQVDGVWMMHMYGDVWDKSVSMYNGQIKPCDIIERPKPASWSGPEDGLPPVGTICEVRQIYGDSEWKIREIIYISYHNLITADGVLEYHDDCRSVEFRPIKTPEQLAAEKRETAIREIMDIADVDCRVTAGRLVDAGFKREVV